MKFKWQQKINNLLAQVIILNILFFVLAVKLFPQDSLKKFFYLFSLIPLLALILILAFKQLSGQPELVEGELIKKKKNETDGYEKFVINFLTWLGIILICLLLGLIIKSYFLVS